MAKKVYAVKKGRETGIFSTWEECKQKVHGYPGAQYKSFPTLKEAQDYLQGTINREMPEISPEEVFLWLYSFISRKTYRNEQGFFPRRGCRYAECGGRAGRRYGCHGILQR